jgi:signal transduction histidine kinase
MAPETQEKLFEPFTQEAKNDTNSFGMGMNIVYKIIQKHGGEIWLESQEGKGTTVFFTLNAGT